MGSRLDLRGVAPRTYAMMARLSEASHSFGLEPLLVELMKVRASQINGCAYCVDMHTKDARAAGEDEQRLHLLVAWREADWYSERERAALELTEAMTRLPEGGVTVINAWNRVAITTRMEPGHYQPGGHE
jgi:AhpD family alkylhydroperoxidase